MRERRVGAGERDDEFSPYSLCRGWGRTPERREPNVYSGTGREKDAGSDPASADAVSFTREKDASAGFWSFNETVNNTEEAPVADVAGDAAEYSVLPSDVRVVTASADDDSPVRSSSTDEASSLAVEPP